MDNRYQPEKQETEVKQEWKHYLPPTPLVSDIIEERELVEEQNLYAKSLSQKSGMCLKVREKLQSLLEGEYELKPEMAMALQGHLAVCPDCAFEYEEMKNLVWLLKSMPMADLPMDYSKVIMQRIMAQQESTANGVQTPVSSGGAFTRFFTAFRKSKIKIRKDSDLK